MRNARRFAVYVVNSKNSENKKWYSLLFRLILNKLVSAKTHIKNIITLIILLSKAIYYYT